MSKVSKNSQMFHWFPYQSTAFHIKINHVHWIFVGGGPFFWHILRFSYQKPLSLLLDARKIIQTFGTFGSTDFSPSRVDELKIYHLSTQHSTNGLVPKRSQVGGWFDPVETYWIGQILDRFPLLGSRLEIPKIVELPPPSSLSTLNNQASF